jgi:hypothetical protein
MIPLRERMAEDRIRNYTPRTLERYVSMMERFTSAFAKPPGQLGPAEIASRPVGEEHEHPRKYPPYRILGVSQKSEAINAESPDRARAHAPSCRPRRSR